MLLEDEGPCGVGGDAGVYSVVGGFLVDDGACGCGVEWVSFGVVCEEVVIGVFCSVCVGVDGDLDSVSWLEGFPDAVEESGVGGVVCLGV